MAVILCFFDRFCLGLKCVWFIILFIWTSQQRQPNLGLKYPEFVPKYLWSSTRFALCVKKKCFSFYAVPRLMVCNVHDQKVWLKSPLTTTQCHFLIRWTKIGSTFSWAIIPAVQSFRRAVDVLDILYQSCNELNHQAGDDFGLCERTGRGLITPVCPFSWSLT